MSLQLVASDPDGTPVTYSATGLPASLTVNATSGLISGTLTYTSAGSYTVTATASDGTLTDSRTFTWTVTNVNRAPTLTQPANQTSAENASVSLQLVASDPDGTPLTYSATGLPASLTVNATSGLISGTLSYTSAGSYTVTSTASDGTLSISRTFTWTVTNVNRAPTLTQPANQTSAENASVSLQLVASDPDGTPVTYSATGLPASLTINATSGLISGTLTYTSAGSYTVTVTASDGTLSISRTFTWTVTNVNRAPALTQPANQSSAENASVSLQLVASDPDGTPVTYSATGLPASLAVNATSGLISGTLSNGSAGTYTVTATASDGTLSTSRTFTWTVTTKLIPVITWANPAAIVYGTALSATQLNATASVAGSFQYTPAAGTVLPAGSQQLSVLFTPTDPITYTTASASVTLVVRSGPAITTQPPSQSVNAGATASFSAAASGYPAPTVRWQVSANGGSTWADIAGATSATYTFTAMASDDGHQYRAVFTNVVASASTNAATLTVIVGAPVIVTDPTSVTKVRNRVVSFTAEASGDPAPSAQWQVSKNGGLTWTDRPGATDATLSFVAQMADSGSQYRAVFTNTRGSANTRAATLTVRKNGKGGELLGPANPDLLWRSQATGANAVWDLGAAEHIATGWLTTEPDLGWALVGNGDVNGDGQTDLLWRNLATGANAAWYLDGLNETTTDALDAELDLDWLVVGTGDLNGDGKPDLVWRHRVSGEMRVWYLDGVTRLSTGTLDTIAEPEWAVVGTGDLNGDGTPDLVLRNGATGANHVLYLSQGATLGGAPLDPEPDLTWAVVGTGDYNGDGQLDLLWRNVLTGAFRMWYLNGTALLDTGVMDAAVPFTWTVAGNGSSAPGTPTGPTATANGSSIAVSWTAPTTGGRPTAYVIEAGDAPGYKNLAAFSTGGTGTSFTATGVARGRYLLRVRAVNGAGSSAPSNEVELVVGPRPPAVPGAPANLTATVAGSSVTLSWIAPTTGSVPTAYQVEAGSWPGASDLTVFSTGTPATGYWATGVANGTYYVRVRAASAAGLSASSNEVPVLVGPPPQVAPGAPSGLTAAAVGSTITLSWQAPATGGAPASYRIEAGSGPGLSDVADFSTGHTAATFSASGVLDGMYYLRVRATNEAGTSAPSNEAVMAVGCMGPPGTPGNFRLVSSTRDAVAFSWNASSGSPTTYVLEAGSAPGSTNLLVRDLGGTATTMSASGLNSGTYYTRLRARNACGTSGVSNEVVVILR